MVKQAKLSPAEKIRKYLRRKYMTTQHAHDRIAVHEDWQEGMNAFRLRTREELVEINKKIDYIMKVLNEQNKE